MSLTRLPIFRKRLLPLGARLGLAAGGAVRGRFSEKTFRRVFFWGLLVLGARLASRALI